MSSTLVTLMSRSDSYFERSNLSFYENRLDGVELDSNVLMAGFKRIDRKFYDFRQTEM